MDGTSKCFSPLETGAVYLITLTMLYNIPTPFWNTNSDLFHHSPPRGAVNADLCEVSYLLSPAASVVLACWRGFPGYLINRQASDQ